LWRGTAASAVDLHLLLSNVFPTADTSYATDIDDYGNIVGYARSPGQFARAVLWTPVPESGVPGDYNNNGAVDVGDYVLWRKGTNNLSNEVANIGSNTPQDYTEWRARFGKPPGSGSGVSGAPVPEPASCALATGGLVVGLLSRHIAADCPKLRPRYLGQ
jgi:hypothetical protein